MNTRRRILCADYEEPEVIPRDENDCVRALINSAQAGYTYTIGYDSGKTIKCYVDDVDRQVEGRRAKLPYKGLNDAFFYLGSGNRFDDAADLRYARIKYPSNGSLFYSTKNLIMLDCLAPTPQGVANYMFKGCASKLRLIRVPKGCREAYVNSACYAPFANIIVETKKFNDFREVYNNLVGS